MADTVSVTQALNSPAPKIGEGRYAYAKLEQLPKMLREQCRDALFFEAEPHVVADAWNIVRMAADELEARLATTQPAPALPSEGRAEVERLRDLVKRLVQEWPDTHMPSREACLEIAALAPTDETRGEVG